MGRGFNVMIQATLKNSSLRRKKTKLLRSSVVVHVPIRWLSEGNGAVRTKEVQGFKLFPRKASCGCQ